MRPGSLVGSGGGSSGGQYVTANRWHAHVICGALGEDDDGEILRRHVRPRCSEPAVPGVAAVLAPHRAPSSPLSRHGPSYHGRQLQRRRAPGLARRRPPQCHRSARARRSRTHRRCSSDKHMSMETAAVVGRPARGPRAPGVRETVPRRRSFPNPGCVGVPRVADAGWAVAVRTQDVQVAPPMPERRSFGADVLLARSLAGVAWAP